AIFFGLLGFLLPFGAACHGADAQVSEVLQLAQEGRLQEALVRYATVEPSLQASLREELAWLVVRQGADSPSLPARLYALIGAGMTHDVRAVELLEKGMRDRNQRVRHLAVQLSASYPDESLRQCLVAALGDSQYHSLRSEAVRALAHFPRSDTESVLLAQLDRVDLPMGQRLALAEALSSFNEAVPDEDVLDLAQSPSAGLRLLSCRLAEAKASEGIRKQLLNLCRDALPDIRMAAFEALALQTYQTLPESILSAWERGLDDIDPKVRITCAWALLVHGRPKGEEALQVILQGRDPRSQRLASAVLSHSGSAGLALSARMLDELDDPACQINLAMALISQRHDTERAAKVLRESLQRHRARLCWRDTQSLFEGVYPQGPERMGPGHAVAVDQMTRLRLLSVVALVEPQHALPLIEGMLNSRLSQVSALALYEVLSEGDRAQIEGLSALLDSPKQQVRVQAALLLALCGRDPTAREVLEEAYPEADRPSKERILEGLGAIGDSASLPLLLSALEEPFETLRIIAAAAVIQCENH
ncbi:MAG: HEAT repeat domain-containing protein, partial [Chlamydiia bacterium]|nr:HEAT repeat domain-containing protein [Chlamydiia bacterium]